MSVPRAPSYTRNEGKGWKSHHHRRRTCSASAHGKMVIIQQITLKFSASRDNLQGSCVHRFSPSQFDTSTRSVSRIRLT